MKRIFAILLTTILAGMPAGAQNFTQLHVFGDSMSDMGNVFLISGGQLPAPPFVDGRFSDGPVYAEVLAESFGLAPLQASGLGGTDYAWAGAKAAEDRSFLGGLAFLPSVLTQVNSYLGDQPGLQADAEALYVVFGGSSDIDLGLEAGLDATSGDPVIRAAAAGIVEAVGLLVAAGAQHVLVLNVPDIGSTPQHANSAGATPLAVLFNQQLAAGLAGLSGVDIRLFDTFALLNQRRSDFAVADAACFDEGSGDVCSNPEDYLFFDDFHPTQGGHQVLADAVLDLYRSTAVTANTWGGVKAEWR